jgi:hypothetical protein
MDPVIESRDDDVQWDDDVGEMTMFWIIPNDQ